MGSKKKRKANPTRKKTRTRVRRRPASDVLHGRILRDAAIDQVEENADGDWKTEAAYIVIRLARTREEFTTDDVWTALTSAVGTHEPRAMGAIMRNAARDCIIEATDRTVESRRSACHRRPIRVWRSLL